MNLRVAFGACSEAKEFTDFDDGSNGFRVEVLCRAGFCRSTGEVVEVDRWLVLPTRFVRKRDSQRAMNALVEAGLDNEEAIDRSVSKVGWEEVRRVMAEAMAW